jgi:tetratricopeptide (TPR) repeat protein
VRLAACAAIAASATLPSCERSRPPGPAPEVDPAAPTSSRISAPPSSTPEEILRRSNDLARSHRIAEALRVIEESRATLQATPAGSPVALALREKEAQLLVNLSRPREAASILEEVVRASPQNESGRVWLATAYAEMGDGARAVDTFETLGVATLADNLVAYGSALAALGQIPASLSVLSASLVRDPWNEPGYLQLGRALARAGRADAAEVFLRRYRSSEPQRQAEQEALGLEVNGQMARAQHRRARAERDRGRLFEAMELENRALRLDPSLGDAYVELARLSVFLGRPDDAIQALSPLPRNEVVAAALEDSRSAAAESGTPAAALRDRTRGKPLSRSVPELLERVASLAAENRAEDARRLALFAARLAPGRVETAAAVVTQFQLPGDVFLRLWALSPLRAQDPWSASFDAELGSLGADPERVRKLLP